MNVILPTDGLEDAERARILAKAAIFAPPPAMLPDGRRDLVGLSREELIAEMAAIGEKPFRAKQLWHWIYHQGETDVGTMTTIAKPMQAKLAARFVVGRPGVATQQDSADSTRKWVFAFRDDLQLGCGGLAWGGGKCWMWFHVEEPQPRHAVAVMHMVKRLKAMARQFGHGEVYTVRDQRWPSSERLLKIIGFKYVEMIDGQEIHKWQN